MDAGSPNGKYKLNLYSGLRSGHAIETEGASVTLFSHNSTSQIKKALYYAFYRHVGSNLYVYRTMFNAMNEETEDI